MIGRLVQPGGGVMRRGLTGDVFGCSVIYPVNRWLVNCLDRFLMAELVGRFVGWFSE